MHTQQSPQDYRAPGVRRVTLDTLVELCGQEPETPAFEGRSVNVSGRGMLVESDFVPEVKTPLVMRFEHLGREVVVEGLVAWREPAKPSGRFGVRFTALDSKSVVVLKNLCGTERLDDDDDASPPPAKSTSPLFAELEESEVPEPVFTLSAGAPMKLHLEGLAAPMKARVVEGKRSKLRVGSQLDFLKLGRPVRVEDLSLDVKRDATVHSVDIQVDAASGVPQLVVTLKWEGCDDVTPAPTVVSSAKGAGKPQRDYFSEDEHTSPGKVARKTSPLEPSLRLSDQASEGHGDDDDDDDFNTAEALLKSRVALWATALSRGIKSASERVAGASHGTTKTVRNWLERSASARSRVAPKPTAQRSTRKLRQDSVPARDRGTRRPQNLHSQRPTAGGKDREGSSLKRSHVVTASAAILCLTVGLYLFGGSAPAENAEAGALAARETAAHSPAVGETALPAAEATPATAPRRQALDSEEQLRPDNHGIVANVPLFGPTQMATTERVAENEETVAASPGRSGVDEVSLAKDESFSDKVVADPPDQASQRSFQVGRMNLPVIHRLRLDAPAELLQGEKTPNGFSVLIPGRKVMESGAGIASRDERITQVSAKNTPAGARILFRFGKDIPGYKARLRNDYVEFFINSP